MKPTDYQKYFKQLMKKYPLRINVPVSLELLETIQYENKSVLGIASLENKKIHIQVAIQDRHPLIIFKTIAHEYRHAMQWVNMGWKSDNPSDPEKEHDANLFGLRVARLMYEYKKNGCKIPEHQAISSEPLIFGKTDSLIST